MDDTVGVKESLNMLCGDVLPEDCADGPLEANVSIKLCEVLPDGCADGAEVNEPTKVCECCCCCSSP